MWIRRHILFCWSVKTWCSIWCSDALIISWFLLWLLIWLRRTLLILPGVSIQIQLHSFLERGWTQYLPVGTVKSLHLHCILKWTFFRFFVYALALGEVFLVLLLNSHHFFLLGNLLSHNHLAIGFLCFQSIQEFFLCEFWICIQIKSADDSNAVLISGFVLVVSEEALEVPGIHEPIAPVVHCPVNSLLWVVKRRLKVLSQLLRLTVQFYFMHD